jgi:hypothetical protein
VTIGRLYREVLDAALADRLRRRRRLTEMCGGSLSSCAHTTRRDAHTVRYRMTQQRELYSDRLNDPQTVLERTLALGIPQHRAAVQAPPRGRKSLRCNGIRLTFMGPP